MSWTRRDAHSDRVGTAAARETPIFPRLNQKITAYHAQAGDLDWSDSKEWSSSKSDGGGYFSDRRRNIPNYASAIVSAKGIVTSTSSL